MPESRAIQITLTLQDTAPITDHPQTPDHPAQAALVALIKRHKHTGIKGTSWDDPAGYKQTCSCGWGKSYRGGYANGRGLWEKHMADEFLDLMPALECIQLATQYQEKVTGP